MAMHTTRERDDMQYLKFTSRLLADTAVLNVSCGTSDPFHSACEKTCLSSQCPMIELLPTDHPVANRTGRSRPRTLAPCRGTLYHRFHDRTVPFMPYQMSRMQHKRG
eukprot:3154238-Pleurochrysis_carterae.AAC.1